MLHGLPSLRVDLAQTMGALQSRQTASNGLRFVSSDMREVYARLLPGPSSAGELRLLVRMPTRVRRLPALLLLAVVRCGGGSSGDGAPAAGSGTIVVQGWPAGATGVLRFYRNATVDHLLLEAPISGDGVAQYALPEPTGLIAYTPPAGVVVDPPDARFQIVANLTTSLDPSDTHTGEVRLGNRLVHPAPQAGDTLVQLWYADRPTTVTGSAGGCAYEQQFQAGWNYSLTRVDALEPYACAHSAAAALRPGLAWHYLFLGP